MKLYCKIFLLFMMILICFPYNGSCLWPLSKNNDYDEKEIIQEYSQFEKKNDFSDEMLKTIKKAVKGKGKNNLTLRMAYMRLRYYEAVQNKDQSSIQEVSNEAESLLKGDHPFFRQDIRERKVRNFLSALKDARYNEKRSTNWNSLILFVIIFTTMGIIGGAVILKGIGAIIGAALGMLAGIGLYFGFGVNIFYKITVDYSNLPPVPFLS